MNDEHDFFLNRLMNRYNIEYPARYKAGVAKYKTIIHLDYTIPQHVKNIREELYDAMAYLEALDILFEKQDKENAKLKQEVEELNTKLDQARQFMKGTEQWKI